MVIWGVMCCVQVNWDVSMQTAVSDLEVVARAVKGKMYTVKYYLSDSAAALPSAPFLLVATTRPETIFGDCAVAINPSDSTKSQFVGRSVLVPLTRRTIPVIADAAVDISLGTGALKVTPAHDFTDFEIGQRHALKPLVVIDKRGNMSGEHVPQSYVGMPVARARVAVVEELRQMGLLVNEDDIEQSVPYVERTGVVVEPVLTTQWFLDSARLAPAATQAVMNGSSSSGGGAGGGGSSSRSSNNNNTKNSTLITPPAYASMFFDWMKAIQPWCISRQIWWGHRIPAFYSSCGRVFVAESLEEAELAAKTAGAALPLVQDDDVLDTWFSSGMWPFAVLGLESGDEVAAKQGSSSLLYPTHTLVTGFDILFFWVARMMMLSSYATGVTPFSRVIVHGLVRDEFGAKMSKSKGNVIDPLEWSKQYGTDAVRFSLCLAAVPGRDVRASAKRVEASASFVNKLYNASRMLQFHSVLPPSQPLPAQLSPPSDAQHPVNIWILDEVARAAAFVDQKLTSGRLDEAAVAAQKFVWDVYCSQYLEMFKTLLTHDASAPPKADSHVWCEYSDMPSPSAYIDSPSTSSSVSSESLATCVYVYSAVLNPCSPHPVFAPPHSLPGLAHPASFPAVHHHAPVQSLRNSQFTSRIFLPSLTLISPSDRALFFTLFADHSLP
jgi:valyl-tRNA synthetase